MRGTGAATEVADVTCSATKLESRDLQKTRGADYNLNCGFSVVLTVRFGISVILLLPRVFSDDFGGCTRGGRTSAGSRMLVANVITANRFLQAAPPEVRLHTTVGRRPFLIRGVGVDTAGDVGQCRGAKAVRQG